MAGCKALGLVSRYITSPLWNLIENKDVHIFDMKVRFTQLHTCLQDASDNPQAFMTGELLPFGTATVIKKDCFLEELLKPYEHDATVEIILRIMLSALAKTCQHLFKDHLYGGRYYETDEHLYHKTISTPKHNKFAESVFEYTDHLMVTKPSISTIACEAYAMCSNNKSMQWLDGKTAQDIDRLLTEARRETRCVISKFRTRHKEIQTARYEAVQQKLAKEREARRRKLQEREKYTDDIVLYGLWQSPDEVNNMVQSFSSKKEKVKAMKAQLRFRQHVLNQTAAHAASFVFSKSIDEKRRELTPEELKDNLRTLVMDVSRQPSDGAQSMLVGHRIRHRFVPPVDVWYFAKVLSQVCICYRIFYFYILLCCRKFYFLCFTVHKDIRLFY